MKRSDTIIANEGEPCLFVGDKYPIKRIEDDDYFKNSFHFDGFGCAYEMCQELRTNCLGDRDFQVVKDNVFHPVQKIRIGKVIDSRFLAEEILGFLSEIKPRIEKALGDVKYYENATPELILNCHTDGEVRLFFKWQIIPLGELNLDK